jgi:glycosyltransferase involved in cell wall biosynthesis
LAAWERAALPALSGLVVAGKSYLRRGRASAMVQHCRRANSIRLFDRYLSDDELATWLQAADVLVAPYTAASQSAVAGLAPAFDIRLIASDVGGLGEQARAARATLIEPGNVDSLAAALSVTLSRPYDAAHHHRGGAMPESVAGRVVGSSTLAQACLSLETGE